MPVVLAQVLEVDGLVVMVDEHFVEHPAVVVESLSPLGHGLVPYLARLLGHERCLLIPLTLWLPKEIQSYSPNLVEGVSRKFVPRNSYLVYMLYPVRGYASPVA
jgi:hypothetical protein